MEHCHWSATEWLACVPLHAHCGTVWFFQAHVLHHQGTSRRVSAFMVGFWLFNSGAYIPSKKKKTPVHIYIVNQETNFPIMHACHSIFICSKYIEPLLHAKKTGSGNNKRNYYAYASWCPNFVWRGIERCCTVLLYASTAWFAEHHMKIVQKLSCLSQFNNKCINLRFSKREKSYYQLIKNQISLESTPRFCICRVYKFSFVLEEMLTCILGYFCC